MPTDVQILPRNSSHKVRELVDQASKTFEIAGTLPADASMLAWAWRYFQAEVIGIQADNTLEAKRRDLETFMRWYHRANGHLAIEDWLPRDTKTFLKYLEGLGRAPTTINRMLATLRRFARWVHEQPDTPFRSGLPTRGIKELVTDEPAARRLERREVFRLFKAADNLVLTEKRRNARPRRNRALLALLYYTGLRVSELCRLRLEQYDGRRLQHVRRKGKTRSRVYVSTECRRYLDEYLNHERPQDVPSGDSKWLLLPAGGKGSLSPRQVQKILDHLAEEASKHAKEPIELHPHRLRHTFGYQVRQKTGSDTETAALLGHAGLKYVGRYARATDAERESVLDSLDVSEGLDLPRA